MSEVETEKNTFAETKSGGLPDEVTTSSTMFTRPRLRTLFFVLGPVITLLVGGYLYLTGGKYVSTEDAYVKANKVAIGAQVVGRVAEILVNENQRVEKGEILFAIESDPYKILLAQTDAALRQVLMDVEELKASFQEQHAKLQLAKVNLAYAESEFKRKATLVQKKIISKSRYEEAQHERAVAHEEISVLRQDLSRILVKLGGGVSVPVEQLPRYQVAKARRDRVKLDIEYTVVRAPFAGVASNRPQIGRYVKPGDQVMSIVSDVDMWIEANLKETQLTHVRVGQSVRVLVDAYPSHIWNGKVESISPATGAEFSVLPPQNATGNWVKVVQRVPVKILVDSKDSGPLLRAGMSTEVRVEINQNLRAQQLIQTLFDWLHKF